LNYKLKRVIGDSFEGGFSPLFTRVRRLQVLLQLTRYGISSCPSISPYMHLEIVHRVDQSFHSEMTMESTWEVPIKNVILFTLTAFFLFFSSDKADTTLLGIMRHDPCGSFSITRTNLSFYIITRLSSMSFGTIDNGVYLFI
jgi:hypothetical protein